LESRGTGSTALGIKASKLKTIAVSVPPLSEQSSIIFDLDTLCKHVDAIVERELSLIELLQELRTSLISEVVTGKIDVTIGDDTIDPSGFQNPTGLVQNPTGL